MAKENTVRLFGVVNVIKCIINEKGEFVSGRAFLTVVSRARMTSHYIKQGPKRTDGIIVFSRDAVVIKYMARARVGDVVFVKGTAVQQDIERKFTCYECGHETVLLRSTTEYIDPIYFGIRARMKSNEFNEAIDKKTISEFVRRLQTEENVDFMCLDAEGVKDIIARYERERYQDSEGIAILNEKQMNAFMSKQGEIGNEFAGFGTLTKDPDESDFYPGDAHHAPSFKWQMALNRLRHILSDDPDKRTDFYYFICYGKYARFYFENLKKGSTVYVTGPIMTRKFERKLVCENCGAVSIKPGLATEIKVQNLVFVKNCGVEMKDIGTMDYDDISDAQEEEERLLAEEIEKRLETGEQESKEIHREDYKNDESDYEEDESEYADDESDYEEDESEYADDESNYEEDESEYADDEYDYEEDESEYADDESDYEEDESEYADDEYDYEEDESEYADDESDYEEYESEYQD